MRWPDWSSWRRQARPAAPPAASAPSRPPPGWHGLPPVQRAVAPMPLTAPVSRLTAALSSWADPRFLAPLGHVVDPDGPSGRVEGVVRPVGAPLVQRSGPDLPLVSATSRRTGRTAVQRSRWGVRPPPPTREALHTASAGAPPHDASGAGAPPQPPETALGPVSEDAPSWTLPSAPPASGPWPLTEAGGVGHEPVARPVAPVQRTTAPSEAPGAVEPSALPEQPAGDPEPRHDTADVVPPVPADPGDDAGGAAGLRLPDPVPEDSGTPFDQPTTSTSGATATPLQVVPLVGGDPALADSAPTPGGQPGDAPSRTDLPVTPLAVQRTAFRPEPGVELPAGDTAPAGRARRSRIGAPLSGPVDLQGLDSRGAVPQEGTGPALRMSPTASSPATSPGPGGGSPAAAPVGAPPPVEEVRGPVGTGDDGPAPAARPSLQMLDTPLPSVTRPERGVAPDVSPATDASPPVEEVRGLVGAPDDGPLAAVRLSLQRAAPRGTVGDPVRPRAGEEGPVQWLSPDDPLPVPTVRVPGAGGSGTARAAVQRTADPAAPPVPALAVPPAPAGGSAAGDGAQAESDGDPPSVQRTGDPAGRSGAPPSRPRDGDAVAGTSPGADLSAGGAPDPVRTVALLGERPLPTGSPFTDHGSPVSAAVQRSAIASAGRTPEPVAGTPPRPGSTGVGAGDTRRGTAAAGSPTWVAEDGEAVVVARWETPDPVVMRWAADADPSGAGSVHRGGSPGPGSRGHRGDGPGGAAGASPAPGVAGAGTTVAATVTWRERSDGAPLGGTPAPALQRVREPASASVRTGASHGDPVGPAALERASVQRAVDPGSVAVAAGIAVREPDGAVVFLPPAASAVTASGTAGADPGALPLSPAPAVQRQTAAGAGPVAREVVVQREAVAVAAPDPSATGPGSAGGSPSTGTIEGPVPAPPPGTAPATAGSPPPDLDELARRLFDPLSARLRAELRLDRERAGVVTDLRH